MRRFLLLFTLSIAMSSMSIAETRNNETAHYSNNQLTPSNDQFAVSSDGSMLQRAEGLLYFGLFVAGIVLADDFWVLIGVEDPYYQEY